MVWRSKDCIGGLLKSTSRLALVAAAGMFVGGVAMPSAKAADLGGDCCADLEERVAELEATTARKGNRKMSLTVTGQVHRSVIWYDDGKSSTTYYGLDNTNSSSRFIFTGSAKVTPFAVYPPKGRATAGVRAQRFVRGEDALTLAWVGSHAPRAVASSGAPVDLPDLDDRRDGSGRALAMPVAGIG